MTIRNEAVIVGTSFLEVSPPSITGPERITFTMTNTSTAGQVITLAIGQQAIAGSGIVLYPGGWYSESKDPSFPVTQDKINAVSTAAGGILAIHERRGLD